MIDTKLQALMPSAAVADELDQMARDDPRVCRLALEPADAPEEPEARWIGGEPPTIGSYPITEIPLAQCRGKLWVGRIPGDGDAERIAAECDTIYRYGIHRVVCLVAEPELLGRYSMPTYLARARQRFGNGFRLVEGVDHQAPGDDSAFEHELEVTHELLTAGQQVLVHCRGGCGRAGTFAICLMIRAGVDPEEAIHSFWRCRRCGPTSNRQVAYTLRYARRLGSANRHRPC